MSEMQSIFFFFFFFNIYLYLYIKLNITVYNSKYKEILYTSFSFFKYIII